MQRAPLFTVLLLVVAAAAVPWWSGIEIERRYHAFVASVENDPAWGFGLAPPGEAAWTLRSERYERGLFRSRAVTLLEHRLEPAHRGRAAEPVGSLALRFEHRIGHGPWPVTRLASGSLPSFEMAHVRTTVEWQADGPEVPPDLAHGVLPFEVETTVERGVGRVEVYGRNPESGPLAAPAGDGGPDWSALRASYVVTPELDGFSGVVGFPGVELVAEGLAIELSGLRSELDYRRDPTGVWVGRSESALDDLVLEVDGVPWVGIQALGWRDECRIRDGLYEVELALDLDTAELAGERFGPLEFASRASRIDPEALMALIEWSEGLAVSDETGAGEIDPHRLAEIGERLAAFFAPRPVLEIERARVETPEGRLRLAGRVGFSDPDPFAAGNPLLALAALEAQAGARVPRAIALDLARAMLPRIAPAGPAALRGDEGLEGAAAELLESLLGQGWLREVGDDVVLDLRFHRGELYLNGAPLPLSGLPGIP